MQELIEHQLPQQADHHSAYAARIPQISALTLMPSPTPSPNSWTGISSTISANQNAYQPQFMADSVTYPFASHLATNSLPKVSTTQNYFQSEIESMSNQTESHSRPSSHSINKSALKKKKASKSSYKHIPHREKPIHLVARRNARERRRVQAVNTAFAKLRKCVPVENRNKRLSKVKTLHRAIEYISALQDLLRDADQRDGIRLDTTDEQYCAGYMKLENESVEKKYNKENRIDDQKWISFDLESNHYSESHINNYNNYRFLKCMP